MRPYIGANGEKFLAALGAEIAAFQALADFHRHSDEELTEVLRDTQLLAAPDALNRIIRYEAVLERQFERLLRHCNDWRCSEQRRSRVRFGWLEDVRSKTLQVNKWQAV